MRMTKHNSAVFQEVYLFDRTILENVRLVRFSTTDCLAMWRAQTAAKRRKITA